MTAFLHPRFWTRNRVLALFASCTVVAVFAAANAHLIAVSLASRPDCVPHLKSPQEGTAQFRAAMSSC